MQRRRLDRPPADSSSNDLVSFIWNQDLCRAALLQTPILEDGSLGMLSVASIQAQRSLNPRRRTLL